MPSTCLDDLRSILSRGTRNTLRILQKTSVDVKVQGFFHIKGDGNIGYTCEGGIIKVSQVYVLTHQATKAVK